eukprot:CAMPEP_0171203514 /NCGR_PEP_ID=MMETSP0790-20130122/25560_1 /TAXON_ID=2925 /ORGANISM="Alexandrium catenella, Strain OF101" /LENGTH=39 /DNA_ID= /DNA_START= /DNA_END= /DNA_ORIENTATION=
MRVHVLLADGVGAAAARRLRGADAEEAVELRLRELVVVL